jgi:glycosyltransferase involved in cell wall biosynthesis
MDLTVVLISKNQEWNIARLIESVIQATESIPSHEIILVDSASTDKTITIASYYPIRILRLRPDQRLTSSAGRYIGYKNSTGTMILFLDGDMELCTGWLQKGINILGKIPDVAVVSGPWIDFPRSTPYDDKKHLSLEGYHDDVVEITEVGGAAMYRRSVLNKIGTFNPYLYSDEEPELSIRIRHAGYRIVRIGYPIAFHFSDPSDAISTLYKRRKRNLWLGMGQNIRQHLKDGLLLPYVKERGFGCLPTLALLAGLLGLLIYVLSHNWLLIIIWILLLILYITLDILRKHSMKKTLFSLVQKLFVIDGTIRGFLIKPMAPNAFPDNYDVIQ